MAAAWQEKFDKWWRITGRETNLTIVPPLNSGLAISLCATRLWIKDSILWGPSICNFLCLLPSWFICVFNVIFSFFYLFCVFTLPTAFWGSQVCASKSSAPSVYFNYCNVFIIADCFLAQVSFLWTFLKWELFWDTLLLSLCVWCLLGVGLHWLYKWLQLPS